MVTGSSKSIVISLFSPSDNITLVLLIATEAPLTLMSFLKLEYRGDNSIVVVGELIKAVAVIVTGVAQLLRLNSTTCLSKDIANGLLLFNSIRVAFNGGLLSVKSNVSVSPCCTNTNTSSDVTGSIPTVGGPAVKFTPLFAVKTFLLILLRIAALRAPTPKELKLIGLSFLAFFCKPGENKRRIIIYYYILILPYLLTVAFQSYIHASIRPYVHSSSTSSTFFSCD